MSTHEITLSDGRTVSFTRVRNNINGNPRYVCHFMAIPTVAPGRFHIADKYQEALNKAKKFGGRKFHNKQFGGGIVFQSYNLNELKPLFEANE